MFLVFICFRVKRMHNRPKRNSASTEFCILKGLSHEIDFENVDENLQIYALKGLSHEIDFKNFDKKLHNLA